MLGGFIKKDENKLGVWENVADTTIFNQDEVRYIKNRWMEYISKVAQAFDPEAELERIRKHQADKSALLSPLWGEWGANHSVETKIDFDYSSNIKMQRAGIKDKDRTVTDTKERGFAGALMCCDTPERTISFLVACFCDAQDIGIGERLNLIDEVTKYVNLQMQIAFICKWESRFSRPSDYEFSKSYKETVSLIPHPDHGSAPSGHSTVGKAVEKYLLSKYHYCSRDFNQLCDEVGTARITVGIHWFTDHEAASWNVENFHNLVMSYMK